MSIQEDLKKLITFKSTPQNHKEQRRVLAWIKAQVKNLPIEIREYTINKFPSLIITTQDTKQPILWLQAHIDVVPGSAEIFRPKIKGKRLYGRGAYDMKFAVACYIKLLKDLRKDLRMYDFGLMITSDEEVGGQNGVKALISKGYHSDACFLPDAGEEWTFERAAKGIMRIKVVSKGKASHGSRPWEGENAIEKLTAFLTSLKEYFPDSLDETPDHYHNTCNVGTIEGGQAINMVPDRAVALVEFRFTHESSKEEILKSIEQAKDGYEGIEIIEELFINSTNIDPENQFIQTYKKTIRKAVRKRAKFMYSHGSTDARFFSEVGIPTILLRPRGGGHHSEKEWVDVKSLEQFYEVLREFVVDVAKFKGIRKFKLIRMIKSFIRFFRRQIPI